MSKGFRFLLCVIKIYSKYAWVIPLQVKKDIAITNTFQKVLKERNRKSKKYELIKVLNFTINQWNHG